MGVHEAKYLPIFRPLQTQNSVSLLALTYDHRMWTDPHAHNYVPNRPRFLSRKAILGLAFTWASGPAPVKHVRLLVQRSHTLGIGQRFASIHFTHHLVVHYLYGDRTA